MDEICSRQREFCSRRCLLSPQPGYVTEYGGPAIQVRWTCYTGTVDLLYRYSGPAIQVD